jgi:hypothetical protein
MLVFGIIVTASLKVFSKKYGWKAGRGKVKRGDILRWGIYGAVIPLWIELDIVFSYVNLPMTTIAAMIVAVIFASCYAACRNKGVSFFPVPLIATAAVTAAMIYSFTPPSPENWSAYFYIGIKADELLYFYSWLAPPWIVGMAYLRSNLSEGYIALPIAVFLYFLMFLYLYPVFKTLGYEASMIAVYIIVVIIVLGILRRVKG